MVNNHDMCFNHDSSAVTMSTSGYFFIITTDQKLTIIKTNHEKHNYEIGYDNVWCCTNRSQP